MALSEENKDPFSFHIKSRRWSHSGHGAGLGLTTQGQKNPCSVNPHVTIRSEFPWSLVPLQIQFQSQWQSSWLVRSLQTQVSAPERHQSQTPLSCWFCGSPFQVWAVLISCVGTTYFNGYQLSLFSFSLWIASLKQFSKSLSFCPLQALHESRLQGQSLFAEVSSQIFLDKIPILSNLTLLLSFRYLDYCIFSLFFI